MLLPEASTTTLWRVGDENGEDVAATVVAVVSAAALVMSRSPRPP
jgi:hypothetical protein